MMYQQEPRDDMIAMQNAVMSTIQKMSFVENQKAVAIHNCVATSACQLLRKPIEKLQGMSGQSTKAMFYDHPVHNMVEEVTQRCLSHTELYRPDGSPSCKV